MNTYTPSEIQLSDVYIFPRLFICPFCLSGPEDTLDSEASTLPRSVLLRSESILISSMATLQLFSHLNQLQHQL